MDQQMAQTVAEQAFAYWINPELERRRENGEIGDDFVLFGVQIIFEVDRPEPEVRLNDQVRAVALAKAARAIAKGEEVTHDDIDQIEDIELTEADPNAGHITIVFGHPKGWVLAFDLRYNATHIAEHIAAAQGFVDSAADSIERPRAFVESLWSAVELMAKGFLIFAPDKELLTSKTHRIIHSRFNESRKLQNVEGRYADLLNQLTKLRKQARYPSGEFILSPDEIHEMLETAQEMLMTLREQSPTRRSRRTLSAARAGVTVPSGTTADTFRRRRDAAAKYLPTAVRLLIVAEAPPRTLDRYFYFESVNAHDHLFRYVCLGVLGSTPARAET